MSLSRRNVLSLLHKLDRNKEEGMKAVRTLMREQDDGRFLTVVIEPDEDHYTDREAGEMRSDIEAKLAREEREQREHEDALARFDAGE